MHVDKWVVDYVDNSKTGEADQVEYFSGEVSIGQTDEQTYLGFVISNRGENMNNIQSMSATSVERVSSPNHFAELQLTGIDRQPQ